MGSTRRVVTKAESGKSVRYSQVMLWVAEDDGRDPACGSWMERKLEAGWTPIWPECEPNSPRRTRPICVVNGDENDPLLQSVCLAPIEEEYAQLENTVMKVDLAADIRGNLLPTTLVYYVRLHFIPCMYDEKLARIMLRMEASGSNYICTLCTANRRQTREKIGTYTANRRVYTHRVLAHVQFMPYPIPRVVRKHLCVGVKTQPLFPDRTHILSFVVDATHADINVSGIFMEK
ncbi:low-affinity glucose transporter protein rag1, partial [Borealophlyctis nickersoniae]